MCQFISWIEHDGKILFLTDDELSTPRGYELREYLGRQFNNDIIGHGAIRWYYHLNYYEGFDHECTDFTDSKNFPSEITQAIKQGLFEKIANPIEGILSKPVWEKYVAELRAFLYPEWESTFKVFKALKNAAFWNLVKEPNNRVKKWQ